MDLKPKSLFRRVIDFAREEIERRSRPPAAPEPTPGSAPEPREPAVASRASAPESVRPGATLLEVQRSIPGRLSVRWTVGSDDLSRSRALLHGDAVLCLRIVAFEGTRDDVRREVLDRPFVEVDGGCELVLPEARGVVSVGLRAGERFVSIAHHVL